MAEAGPSGLESWVYLPATPGKHPLVLLTHPWRGLKHERSEMSPAMLEPEALWFARRGWAVAVVMRMGFGTSGGDAVNAMVAVSRRGSDESYPLAERDLHAAYDALIGLPQIDPTRVIAVGDGDGGAMAILFGSKPLPGLKGIVNVGQQTYSVSYSVWKAMAYPNVLFTRVEGGPSIPMLWLHPKHCDLDQCVFAGELYYEWKTSGRPAESVDLDAPFLSGDSFDKGPQVWGPPVEKFLAKLGLPATPTPPE